MVRAMHHDQVPIDVEIARATIGDQFPAYRGEPIMPLDAAAGTVHAIFRIGTEAAARFPLQRADPAECAETLRREAAATAEFASCSPVASPRPIGLGRPGPLYPMPWAVQSWIPGDVASPDGLAASDAFAADMAGLIAALRRADVRGRRFDGRGRGGHLRDHDGWMAVCFANSAGLVDVARLRRLWSRLRELPARGPDVMSHRDLIPANLLVRGGRLAGIIDCGGFGPADRALDLVAAWHLFDRDRRDILRRRLAPADGEWRRGAAWALEQAMGLVWYYRSTNPAMSALGRSTLSRLLDDPDI